MLFVLLICLFDYYAVFFFFINRDKSGFFSKGVGLTFLLLVNVELSIENVYIGFFFLEDYSGIFDDICYYYFFMEIFGYCKK